MGCVHMQETGGKDPYLLPSLDSSGIELIFLKKVGIFKTFEGKCYVGSNYDQGDYVQFGGV